MELNEILGIPATVERIEAFLGYPISKASRVELRGVIAGLNAVNRPTVERGGGLDHGPTR